MTTILTLRLDEKSQAHFEAMRQRYFPPERNQIAAHLTMFHTLPREVWVEERLEQATRELRAFALRVTGVRSLGKGVVYRLGSSELTALHARLAEAFAAELTPQDRQRFQAHVVVQNKATPAAARALLENLERNFLPWTVHAVGLDLWHYLGGPWELARVFPFLRG